ncbi:MAG: HD-GYP domain-containing protein [Treponema sp.]|jgi:HD-GYP domain-containing protein (c-di-GMP phosphodiesterase class II)|nr:HD-GYP domain-containing protein [Treponema sp.]
MIKYSVNDLKEESAFSSVIYLDNQFILATPEMCVSQKMKQSLKNWEFAEILSDGEPIVEIQVEAEKAPHIQLTSVTSQYPTNDEEKIVYVEHFYTAFKDYMESVFEKVGVENILDYKELTDHVRSACAIIREDRRFLLRSQKSPSTETEKDYMASHAVHSMIISIIIGLRLKLSDEKLIELGVAALLHEIGMLKLPKESKGYYTKRPLTQNEKKAITSHPVLSYSILKSFNTPLAVCLAGLEHHERENGGGYPQKLTGDKISLYAKIIAVACSYDALTTNRPHKEAENGHMGMLYILKNEEKQYNETIVKALLYSISLYPIGLFVLLSNGKKAQVIDVNPENPLYPIVQVFGVFTSTGENVIIETSKQGVYVVRPLTKTETGRTD